MLKAVEAIERMPMANDPLLGSALMALTDIISDPYPGYSVIPSRCRVTYDRRLLPKETAASVLSALHADQVNATIAEVNTPPLVACCAAQNFFRRGSLPKIIRLWKAR